ncbi:MAG TPA: SDR family oxidoreductase [Acidobacteria bacterium]|nr:SDR family oxidoreductase [Acidobacteriota bacterium]
MEVAVEPSPLHGAAIVTGGGTGLGLAIASEMARRGYPVVVASRNLERLEAAADELLEAGYRALAVRCDVRDPSSVAELFDQAVTAFHFVESLINNAAGNFVVRAEELSDGGWEAVRGIVLDGTFNCSREAGRRMQERGGSILNIIATYAWTGATGVVHSASAKGGVLAMTRSLAREWGPYGIRVNALAPGIVATENAARNLGFADPSVQARLAGRVPLRRLGTPREVAVLAADLASDRHPYVTGDCWTIDGGLWLAGFPDLRRALDAVRETE